MTRAEEQSLMERAVAGDRVAAEAFIRTHQASLYAYLLRMSGRPELAEDIVQEAFVRVLSNLDKFDPRFRFSTWLFTIAKRLYMNACQKMAPVAGSDMMGAWAARPAAPELPTEESEVEENLRSTLQAVLLTLPTEQREIIILFHQQDWPIWLIAQHMDMPEGTVKSHLHRGRRKMRRLLDRSQKHTRSVGEVWS